MCTTCVYFAWVCVYVLHMSPLCSKAKSCFCFLLISALFVLWSVESRSSCLFSLFSFIFWIVLFLVLFVIAVYSLSQVFSLLPRPNVLHLRLILLPVYTPLFPFVLCLVVVNASVLLSTLVSRLPAFFHRALPASLWLWTVSWPAFCPTNCTVAQQSSH